MKKLLLHWNALLNQDWDERLRRWNIKLEEYAKASSYAIHR